MTNKKERKESKRKKKNTYFWLSNWEEKKATKGISGLDWKNQKKKDSSGLGVGMKNKKNIQKV